jgi:hypothetical protein
MADPLTRSSSPPRKPAALASVAPPAMPAVRLAQLVRTTTSPAPRGGDVVVDLGTTRITIGAGADVATVALVLTLLGGRA